MGECHEPLLEQLSVQFLTKIIQSLLEKYPRGKVSDVHNGGAMHTRAEMDSRHYNIPSAIYLLTTREILVRGKSPFITPKSKLADRSMEGAHGEPGHIPKERGPEGQNSNSRRGRCSAAPRRSCELVCECRRVELGGQNGHNSWDEAGLSLCVADHRHEKG